MHIKGNPATCSHNIYTLCTNDIKHGLSEIKLVQLKGREKKICKRVEVKREIKIIIRKLVLGHRATTDNYIKEWFSA